MFNARYGLVVRTLEIYNDVMPSKDAALVMSCLCPYTFVCNRSHKSLSAERLLAPKSAPHRHFGRKYTGAMLAALRRSVAARRFLLETQARALWRSI